MSFNESLNKEEEGNVSPGTSKHIEDSVWEAINSGNHDKLVVILEKVNSFFWPEANHGDADEHLMSSGMEDLLDRVLPECLATLLFCSAVGEVMVELEGGGAVDLRPQSIYSLLHLYASHHSPIDGCTKLHKEVMKRGVGCLPMHKMKKIIVADTHKQVVRHALHRLITKPNFEPVLPSGIPLIHIILAVGHNYERPGQSTNLFDFCLREHPDAINLQCPVTGMSTLQVAQKHRRDYEADQLIRMLGPEMQKREKVLKHCMGRKSKEKLKYNPSHSLTPELPGVTTHDLVDGIIGMTKLNEVLEIWSQNETTFRELLATKVMHYEGKYDTSPEGRLISTIRSWLTPGLESRKEHPLVNLRMSGSVGEGSKLLPLDEIDLLLQVQLDVTLEVTDKNTGDGIGAVGGLIGNELGLTGLYEQLDHVTKQPFEFLARIMLARSYPDLGQKGEELKAEVFAKYMERKIRQAIKAAPLPSGLRFAPGAVNQRGSPILGPMRTKSGTVLNLEYEAEDGRWQELSMDLVSVLVLSVDQREQLYRVMPDKDKERKTFLEDNNLISSCDGVISKNDRWRFSFSCGERKVIGLYRELYQALKYLKTESENHIDMCTYLLKELFCCFITSPARGPPGESLAMSLVRLIEYGTSHPIATPFYCTRLGSKLEVNCCRLFAAVEQYFPEEFRVVRQERARDKSPS